jgi:hypothetical protein
MGDPRPRLSWDLSGAKEAIALSRPPNLVINDSRHSAWIFDRKMARNGVGCTLLAVVAWKRIRGTLDERPSLFGLQRRRYG